MQVEYVKGMPYFSGIKKIKQFPYLNKPLKCDIVVVGGGIDGAITLYYLAKNHYNCILVDRSRLGLNCTSVATALLEYQLDDNADVLKKCMTEKEIVEAYKLNLMGLNMLKDFVSKTGNHCNYYSRDTLTFGSEKADETDLLNEFEFRKKHGFNVKLFNEFNHPYNFDVKTGLLSIDGGAEANPYLLTKQLITESVKLNAKVFENTEVVDFVKENGKVKVVTNFEIPIECEKIVCSTGYNTSLFTQKQLCNKFVSYSIVTNKLSNFKWHKKTLLQDCLDPYHYIRMLPDNRIIIGGEDTPFKNNTIDEKLAEQKYLKLFDFLLQLFPSLSEQVKIDYKFCGAFSSTKNNLGIVGKDDEKDFLFYNLGYGANGIVNSFVGADIIIKQLKNIATPYQYLFDVNRKNGLI